MKKAAIAFVALPLLCMGAGYGAGLALAPAPAEAAGTKSDDKTAYDAKETAKDAAHAPEKDAHGEASAKDEAQAPMDSYELAKDRTVVRLGQMTIPVEKKESHVRVLPRGQRRQPRIEPLEPVPTDWIIT